MDTGFAPSHQTIDGDRLRSLYLKYFAEHGHAVIPSASVIPENDPSVLFTTAGMHPLVPYLMGRPHPEGARLTDAQKCVRTNDIEEVGDATHLTFFEMLGNWSLGDYFKDESIAFSWEFLTSPDWLNIPKERIGISCFGGGNGVPRDEVSYAAWRALGVPDERIAFLGIEDNWWAAGDEGPCGPDTEIFYDTKAGAACALGSACKPGCKCNRWVEIWNNVFMAYNRTGGQLVDLPKRNVDTGMGLERTLAVLNGVETVYETSAFRPILEALIAKSKFTEAEIRATPDLLKALRITADHLRTSVFVIGDQRGTAPSNQGAGYVLRRLIRRAIRFCDPLGIDPAHWVALHERVIAMFEAAYPELRRNALRIGHELHLEKDRFEQTLKTGLRHLTKEIEELKAAGVTALPGESAFKLYDTYGFPIEFTRELADEQGFSIDMAAYERRFAEHREASRTLAAKSGLADDSEESVRYHTATHLLHAALRDVLGPHVFQKGSNITQERLRFDFNHPKPMTKDEIEKVQSWVQEAIDDAIPVTSEVMSLTDAQARGAIGLFTDKYGGQVSVYSIGQVSMELCGGPHVRNTTEIGRFKITKEQSSSAGVRRIRAEIV
ncbi:MAG: alanyl-tRNA synthetase [Aliidongia sp.]|nr:alanyl-tRNA synthetase [Aliidongia sp.]